MMFGTMIDCSVARGVFFGVRATSANMVSAYVVTVGNAWLREGNLIIKNSVWRIARQR